MKSKQLTGRSRDYDKVTIEVMFTENPANNPGSTVNYCSEEWKGWKSCRII